jgi:hypothetical protein
MNLERDETLEQRLERLGAGTAALRPRAAASTTG